MASPGRRTQESGTSRAANRETSAACLCSLWKSAIEMIDTCHRKKMLRSSAKKAYLASIFGVK
jgi:hypothetical protein